MADISNETQKNDIYIPEPEACDSSLESNKKVNGIPSPSSKPFELLQQWHSQPRKLRIVHVGAGATGLCAAYKLERQMTEYDLVCYDKNSEVGGTWLQNRYPGCACDVPAHIYTYTFEPNPEWKSYYAFSPDIQEYFLNFCEKYGLRKYIKLQHKVIGAVWHEDRGQWAVEVEHGGERFTDWCDILMNGSGLLNQYRCKQLKPLLPQFSGTPRNMEDRR